MGGKINDALISASLPFMLLLLCPITMFLGNRSEYSAGYVIIAGLAAIFFVASSIVFALLRVARLNSRAYRILVGALLGLSAAVWVQSQMLLWDFGPLDGRGVLWEKFATHSKLELAVWVVLVSVILLLCYKNKFVKSLAVGLPLLGLASLIATFAVSAPQEVSHEAEKLKTIQESFAFHKKNNVIFLVLDSYQSDAFQEILDKHPDEVAFLDGFHFYPDTVSGYPTTRHSIPLMLTGKFYKNDFVFSHAAQEKFNENWIGNYFFAKNYGLTGDDAPYPGMQGFSPAAREFKCLGISCEQIQAIDIGLFRATPIVLKKIIYNEGRWFFSRYISDEAPPPPHGGDWRFVNSFTANANTSSDKAGEFKFIHLMGAHYPVSLNENYVYTKDLGDSRDAYVNQARGVLKITTKMIEKLKELGIYDDAEIVIVGDHGAHGTVSNDMKGDKENLDIPLLHIGNARPLFLHKAPSEKGKVRVDNTPMHLAYIPCMLAKSHFADCGDYEKTIAGQPVVRYHYRHKWAAQFWTQDFSPKMTLYEVTGDARNYSSWKNSMQTFYEGKVGVQEAYSLGEKIDFRSLGRSEDFIMQEWFFRKDTYRWRGEKDAVLALSLNNVPVSDLRLTATLGRIRPSFGGGLLSVAVRVNGISVAVWPVLSEQSFDAVIPKAALKSKKIIVSFSIEKPASPVESGLSEDDRRYGVDLMELTLVQIH